MTITTKELFQMDAALGRLASQRVPALGPRLFKLVRLVRAELADAYEARMALMTDENSDEAGPGARKLKAGFIADAAKLAAFNTQVESLMSETVTVDAPAVKFDALAATDLSVDEITALGPLVEL